MINLISIIYILVIIASNQIINWLGPDYTPHVAFFLIPIDFILRDGLQDLLYKEKNNNREVWLHLLGLIIIGGLISYLMNSTVRNIALASAVAFIVSSIIDSIVYSLLLKRSKLIRINISNFFSLISDSILFPTIAFGGLFPLLVFKQSFAKIFGSIIWTLLLLPIINKKGSKC